MTTPTRFEVNGERHYLTDKPDKAYPSVTTILGKTASEKSKNALLNWQLKNPGGSAKAAARGSAIHQACEDYIRGIEVEVQEEYEPFWNGLSKHLDKYDSFIWSERPLKAEWSHCTGEDGISRVWSHEYQYCGCPDLVGIRNGVVLIADFKTSVNPYCRYFPKGGTDRSKFTGWNKFHKCAMQLAAYAQAFGETLNINIDSAQILVSTPETDQSFILHGGELDKFRTKWLQKVRRYKEIKEEEEDTKHLPETRDKLTCSRVSTKRSNNTKHCPAAVG